MVLIAHNELGHDPVDKKDYNGKPVRACPLYPGMTCREHCDAAVDIESTRDDFLTTVPFIELCPNSWLVPPQGKPEQIAEKDQFVAKKVRAAAEAMQKKLGDTVPVKAYWQILNLFKKGESAAEADAWNAALRAYAGVEALVGKPPASLRALVDARVAEVEEYVRFAFEDATTVGQRDATPQAERVAAVRALLKASDVAVYGRKLPVVKDMQAWLKKQG